MSEDSALGKETDTPQWAWCDRWTDDFMRGDTYPALWDEMNTDRFKPVIVWWGDADGA